MMVQESPSPITPRSWLSAPLPETPLPTLCHGNDGPRFANASSLLFLHGPLVKPIKALSRGGHNASECLHQLVASFLKESVSSALLSFPA